MPYCTGCRRDKPAADFGKGGRRDGTACKCKPCLRAYAAAWREANREKVRAYAAQWASDHRESELERYRRMREKHRAKINERARLRMAAKRAADPFAALQYTRAYRQANPERARQWDAKKKAVRRGARGADRVSAAEWMAIKSRHRNRCAYCLERPACLQMDHVIPLATGGRHLASNIVPACPPCNASKQARNAQQWLMEKHGRFF